MHHKHETLHYCCSELHLRVEQEVAGKQYDSKDIAKRYELFGWFSCFCSIPIIGNEFA